MIDKKEKEFVIPEVGQGEDGPDMFFLASLGSALDKNPDLAIEILLYAKARTSGQGLSVNDDGEIIFDEKTAEDLSGDIEYFNAHGTLPDSALTAEELRDAVGGGDKDSLN